MEKKDKLITRLKDKYRLVILNDETFEEKLSLKLSRLNVFVVFGVGSVFLVGITIIIIAFTPLREYIPGYSSTIVRKQALQLTQRADSLQLRLDQYALHLENLQLVLSGEQASDSMDVALDSNIKRPDTSALSPSIKEDDLRQYVEEEDQFNIQTSGTDLSHFSFFTPIKGVVTSPFNLAKGHFAVDVAAQKNTPVKSCLSGTVILSNWTSEAGYTIIVQHSQELISVYKHNSALLKEQGEYVRTGEAISIIGNSGEQTTGPHLHFELWHKGNPVDPANFIAFMK